MFNVVFKVVFIWRRKILHPDFSSVSGIHPDEVMSSGLSLSLLPRLQELGAEELVCFTGHRGDSGSPSSSSSRRVSLPLASAHRMTQLLGSSVNYGMMGHSTARNKSSALVRSWWLASNAAADGGKACLFFKPIACSVDFHLLFHSPFFFFILFSPLLTRYT